MTQSGKAVKLPVKNNLGFFEIRMESIGGLGANVAGKILTEAAIIGMGMNGAGFASYGSEKKGTPVKSFVRICEGGQQVGSTARWRSRTSWRSSTRRWRNRSP